MTYTRKYPVLVERFEEEKVYYKISASDTLVSNLRF